MKCGRVSCEKEAPDGRYYCSKDCARKDADTSEAPSTPSTPIEEQSSTRERGEPSPQFTTEDDRQESDLPSETPPQSARSSTEDTTLCTENESPGYRSISGPFEPPIKCEPTPREDLITKGLITPSTERSGMTGTNETERSTAVTKSQGELPETPEGKSEDGVTNLEVARSATMSLIDESAHVLLGCMKEQAKRTNGEGLRDYRELNAIANVGKQIGLLAKTKLEAIKEARR